MVAKKSGPVPCTLCDSGFASIPNLQQHLRDKHGIIVKTQAPPAQTQPPAQEPPVQAKSEPQVQAKNEPQAQAKSEPQVQTKSEPQVQAKSEPPETPAIPPSDTTTCEHCLAHFPSPNGLRQHKIASHGWRCLKCPTLPPFDNGTAWQVHFNAVHAVTDTKGKVATPEKEVEKPSQSSRGDPELSEGPHSGKINDQHRDASHCINTKVQNVATQPPPPSLANVNQHVTNRPPPEVAASGVTQDESSVSDDKPSSSISKPTSNSEDQTIHADEHEFLSPKGPTLSILVEIESEPHRDRGEVTYEIASDTLSPTVSVSSIETDDSEEEYDVPPSHSSEPLSGSSLEKEKHIIVPPRGPKLGDRESHDTGHPIVAGNRSRHEPDVQARDDHRGITPSTAKKQYEVRPDSPASTTSNSRDTGRDSRQGDLPQDPLRTGRSRTGSTKAAPEIHFGCRICLSAPTPTSNLTATHCGHLFCYECIAAEVLSTSRCPVCKNVLAVYCLFKLDLVS